MRLVIVAVGRFRSGSGAAPEHALFDTYARRLVPHGPAGMTLELREVEEKRPSPTKVRRTAEAALLLAQTPDKATIVALDGKGKNLSSEDLARRLGSWKADGVADLALLIGGADGLDAPLVKRASFVLSLGAMTWPHLLVRAMLAEQIFRAQSILLGHPYHRG